MVLANSASRAARSVAVGKISEMMGDFGKGIKSFKQGMNEGAETPIVQPPAQLQQQPAPTASAAPAPAEQTGSGPAA
jgi:sec-independent protein translocase protein TatA